MQFTDKLQIFQRKDQIELTDIHVVKLRWFIESLLIWTAQTMKNDFIVESWNSFITQICVFSFDYWVGDIQNSCADY